MNKIILFLLMSFPLSAQIYVSRSGLDDYYRMASVGHSGGGSFVAHVQHPLSHLINPSLNAGMQRVSMEIGYLGNVRSQIEWAHMMNLGLGVPTKVGVFTSSVHFFTSDKEILPLGWTSSLHTSFAKLISPQFWFGGALSAAVGGIDNHLDWGLGVTLGSTYTFFLSKIPYIRLGMVARDLGKWYQPLSQPGSFPAPFSLAMGVDIRLMERDGVGFSFLSDIEIPSFQNIRYSLGFSWDLFEIVSLNAAWQIDALRFSTEEIGSLFPSVGLTVTIPLQNLNLRRSATNEIQKGAEITPLFSFRGREKGIWEFGTGINLTFGSLDKTPPVISLQPVETYISPNNDGIQDRFTAALEITDERYVDGYTLFVSDGNVVVRTIANKRPQFNSTSGFFKRLFARDENIVVPSQIFWDGKTDEGKNAPEGEYRVYVEAVDDLGNMGRGAEYRVQVDITPPELSIVEVGSIRQSIFSPNGDGFLDTFPIDQRGGKEDRWVGEIIDTEGNILRREEWNNQTLPAFDWDGTDDEGVLLPDGVYEYRIRGADRAGNTSKRTVSNIIMQTDETPLALRVGTATFSPNADGVSDIIAFVPTLGKITDIAQWKFSVHNVQGTAVYEQIGERKLPDQLFFSGIDASDTPLPEGEYRARILVHYTFGNQPEAFSPAITLDITPPSANVSIRDSIFSPNGDGVKDEVRIEQTSSLEQRWFSLITTEDGQEVRKYEWRTEVPPVFVWDGRDGDGTILDNARYYYQVHATDAAGNSGSSKRTSITLDNGSASILLSPHISSFSPNGDTVRDEVQFHIRLSNERPLSNYQLSMISSEDVLVWSVEGGSALPSVISWRGFSDTGELVLDDKYRARITMTFTNGVSTTAQSPLVEVDTVFPTATVAIDSLIFSPDSDGRKDSLNIAQSSSVESLWIAQIIGEEGNEVYRREWIEVAVTDFQWEGVDQYGNQVEDGRYRYILTSTDEAGNVFTQNLSGIEVKTTPVDIFLTVSLSGISPNGDGDSDSIQFDGIISSTEDAQWWNLDIVNEDQVVIHQTSGDDIESNFVYVWDGKDENGEVKDGIYTTRLQVGYDYGPQPLVLTSSFRVDIIGPVSRVELTPLPFSPDNDGVNDELEIMISVEDISSIAEWDFLIFDRNNKLFQSFSGNTTPAQRLRWDGRSTTGDMVISAEDYPYRFRVKDSLGNASTVEGVIPVDVLVIKDGDRLKVAISAITFQPFSAELIVNNSLQGRKNVSILERLAEVFKKYGSYQVQIEGHAVNLTGTEEEEQQTLQPLSLARANSVRAALAEWGISASRLTVAGLGGTSPLVSHADTENRWKNRRVEFILLK